MNASRRSGDSPSTDRGGPVGRPVLVLAILILSCAAAGYAIYTLILSMDL